MHEVVFILNPAARRGKNRRFLERLCAAVAQVLPEAVLRWTEGPGHAVRLAREAATQGCRRLFAVGGDGTLNEVVNGLMELPVGSRPAVGIVPSGTGKDFFRGLSERHRFPGDFSWMLRPREVPADVGKAVLGGPRGESARYFLNIADAGISGEVVRRVSASRRLLGPMEYLLRTLQAAWSYRAPRVKVRIRDRDGGSWEREMVLLLAVAANGRYFGGGMCIAPEAEIDDGRLFFLAAERIGYLTLVKQLPRVYAKKRIRHPAIHYAEGTLMEIVSQGGDLPIGIDGEFLRAPRVRFEILPQALKILVPSTGGRG